LLEPKSAFDSPATLTRLIARRHAPVPLSIVSCDVNTVWLGSGRGAAEHVMAMTSTGDEL